MHTFGSNESEVFPNPANIFRHQSQVHPVTGVHPVTIFQKQQQQQQPQIQEQQPQIQEQQPQIQEQQPEPKSSEPQVQKVQEPSICIPRVFKSVTRQELYGVFERLDLGTIDRIDMVAKVNVHGESSNKVFIHFKKWNLKSPVAQAAREKLLQGEEIKIVYSDPWFWKCTASRVEKPQFRDYSAPPPRIDLGGCKSMSVLTATTATTPYDDIPCYD